jgi:hypothetical protein
MYNVQSSKQVTDSLKGNWNLAILLITADNASIANVKQHIVFWKTVPVQGT